jgi:hypothetical protein
MNPKQNASLLLTLPALAVAAPPIIVGGLIGGAILLLLKALLSEDKQKQPEAASVEVNTESRKPVETAVFRQFPAEIPAVKESVVLLASAPRAGVPPQVKRKFVTREDLAAVFQRGTRSLTRTAAVVALKKFGFGKTAAYAALSPDGRFSAWLQSAPDGIITWMD